MFGAYLADDLPHSPAANEFNFSDLWVSYQSFCRLWRILSGRLDDIEHALGSSSLGPGFSKAMMCFGA